MGELPIFDDVIEHDEYLPSQAVIQQQRSVKPLMWGLGAVPIASVAMGLFQHVTTLEQGLYAGVATFALAAGTLYAQHQLVMTSPLMEPEARRTAKAGSLFLTVGCALASISLGTISLGTSSAQEAERAERIKTSRAAVEQFIKDETGIAEMAPKLKQRAQIAYDLSAEEARTGVMCASPGYGKCAISFKEIAEPTAKASLAIARSHETQVARAAQTKILLDDIGHAQDNTELSRRDANALIDDRLKRINEALVDGRKELPVVALNDAARALQPEWVTRGFPPEAAIELDPRFRPWGNEAAQVAANAARGMEMPLPPVDPPKAEELIAKHPLSFAPLGLALAFIEGIVIMIGLVLHAQADAHDRRLAERKKRRRPFVWREGSGGRPGNTRSVGDDEGSLVKHDT